MSFFNDFLGHVSAPILLESANYAEMFNDITKALGERPAAIDNAVDAARARLKKNDRVVWFLRLWKIGFAEALLAKPAMAEKFDPRWMTRLIGEYARKAKMSDAQVKTAAWTIFNDAHFLGTMEHYLSLPEPSIQKKVFAFDDPERVLHDFKNAEKTWQNTTKGAFADSEATPLITFPNGLAWFNLNRASCAQEAAAMGHCGNDPRSHTKDTILSLRQVITRGATSDAQAVELHKPILTFVLNDDGFLTEMKGRFNEKPGREYFSEIVALLRDPIVRGIRGGGYRPENNFSLRDLDEATKERLVEEKPGLAGLYDLFCARGVEDAQVMSMLRERLDEARARPATLELSEDKLWFKIQAWGSLRSFSASVEDGIVTKLIDVVEGDSNDHEVYEGFDSPTIQMIIASLPDGDYHKLMRALEVRPVAHNDVNFSKALQLATTRLRHSAYYDMLIDAANQAVGVGEAMSVIEERLRAYIDCGWVFALPGVSLQSDPDDIDAPVSLHISVDDMMRLVTADEESDDDYTGYLDQVHANGGWEGIAYESMTERRQEEGLSEDFGYRAGLASDPVLGKLGATSEGKSKFDAHKIGHRFMRNAFENSSYSTEHQHDLFKGSDK